MVTHPGGLPCACGQRGCYEQYASASALVRSAQTLDACYTSGRAIFADLEKREGLRHVCLLYTSYRFVYTPCVVGGAKSAHIFPLDGFPGLFVPPSHMPEDMSIIS